MPISRNIRHVRHVSCKETGPRKSYRKSIISSRFSTVCTLCEGKGTNDHHIAIGHLGDFQHLNEAVEQDIAGPWKGLLKAAIEKLTDWIHRERWPQKPLTDQEKARLLALMTSRCGEEPSGSVEALIALWWGEGVLGTSTGTTGPPSPAN